ncbi:MAG: hypothetical protein ACRDVN_10840 [Jiangellaceae bacterium]
MTFPADARPGMAVRWVGAEYRDPAGVVRLGDVGTFIDFDGPDRDTAEVVVTFPATGAFVAPREDVEVVATAP